MAGMQFSVDLGSVVHKSSLSLIPSTMRQAFLGFCLNSVEGLV